MKCSTAKQLSCVVGLLIACTDDATGTVSGAGGSAQSSNGGAGGSGASTVSSGASNASGGAGGSAAEKPPGLVSYLSGDDANAETTALGPALILMGGGPDVDAAFERWVPLIGSGDVVVLRTSGADGYGDYLYSDIGGADSVETLLVTSSELANSDYVAQRLAQAEAIFIAGGDQAEYVTAWKGTAVEAELQNAWRRGAVIGGTSAGCAILGSTVFAALNDTVYSDEALADPFNRYMTMEYDFLRFPPLIDVVTDTHFAERDRMGRLITFMARAISDGASTQMVGLGVDEGTALWVGADGQSEVLGAGTVYLLRASAPAAQCVAGQPLEFADVSLFALQAGDTVKLPAGETAAEALALAAADGVTIPADPY
jgi:cyanophycinase